MATIHRTTMTPTKLELLAAWLPRQTWYRPTGASPQLTRAGGFRLDDPAGEVGIEFAFVTDVASTTYHVPMTYRGAPLAEADDALIGTSEHGVLGRRWIYDAARDPVAVEQVLEFVQGRTEAQHQSESDTPDPSVVGRWTSPSAPTASSLELVRVLRPGNGDEDVRGVVEAGWTAPDGSTARGPVAILR